MCLHNYFFVNQIQGPRQSPEKLQSKYQSHSQALTDRMVMEYATKNLDRSRLSMQHLRDTNNKSFHILISTESLSINRAHLTDSLRSVSRQFACVHWIRVNSFNLLTCNHTASSGTYNSKHWTCELWENGTLIWNLGCIQAAVYTQSLKDTCLYVWISDRKDLRLQRN